MEKIRRMEKKTVKSEISGDEWHCGTCLVSQCASVHNMQQQ